MLLSLRDETETRLPFIPVQLDFLQLLKTSNFHVDYDQDLELWVFPKTQLFLKTLKVKELLYFTFFSL